MSHDLERRVREYADQGVSSLPASIVPGASRHPRQPRRGLGTSVAAIGGSIAAGVLAVMVAALLLRPSGGIGAGSSPSGTGVPFTVGPSATFSEAPTASVASPEATAVPTIVGDVPGPEATPPATTSILPTVVVDDLTAPLFGRGIGCESSTGGYPGQEGGFTLYCTGKAGGYSIELLVPYWTASAVEEYHISATPADDMLDSAELQALFEAFAAIPLAGAEADSASTWAGDNLENPACSEPYCEHEFSTVHLVIQIGANGTADLIGKANAP